MHFKGMSQRLDSNGLSWAYSRVSLDRSFRCWDTFPHGMHRIWFWITGFFMQKGLAGFSWFSGIFAKKIALVIFVVLQTLDIFVLGADLLHILQR